MGKRFEIGKRYKLVDRDKASVDFTREDGEGSRLPADNIVTVSDIYSCYAITNTPGAASPSGTPAEDIKGGMYNGIIIGTNADLESGAFELIEEERV